MFVAREIYNFSWRDNPDIFCYPDNTSTALSLRLVIKYTDDHRANTILKTKDMLVFSGVALRQRANQLVAEKQIEFF